MAIVDMRKAFDSVSRDSGEFSDDQNGVASSKGKRNPVKLCVSPHQGDIAGARTWVRR